MQFNYDCFLERALSNVVLVRTLSHNKDGFTRENMERITCMTLYLSHFTNVNVLCQCFYFHWTLVCLLQSTCMLAFYVGMSLSIYQWLLNWYSWPKLCMMCFWVRGWGSWHLDGFIWIIERGAQERIMPPLAIRATKTAPVHASINWYLENVLPIFQRSVWLGYSSY